MADYLYCSSPLTETLADLDQLNFYCHRVFKKHDHPSQNEASDWLQCKKFEGAFDDYFFSGGQIIICVCVCVGGCRAQL